MPEKCLDCGEVHETPEEAMKLADEIFEQINAHLPPQMARITMSKLISNIFFAYGYSPVAGLKAATMGATLLQAMIKKTITGGAKTEPGKKIPKHLH